MSIDWFEISRGRAVAEKEFSEMKADHVSKAELRAWCEGMKKASDNHVSLSSIAVSAVLAGVLEKFCKGEV